MLIGQVKTVIVADVHHHRLHVTVVINQKIDVDALNPADVHFVR